MLNFMPFTGSKKESDPMDVAFWLSFSPIAPVFGVKYRFADVFKFDSAFMPGFDAFMPSAKPAAKPAAKAPAKKAPAKKAEAPAKAPVKKAEAPAKPKAKKAEAPKPVEVEAPAKPKAKAEKPAPKAKAEPKVEEAPVEAPAATDRPATLFDAPPAKVDDLKLIKGVGPKLEGMLNGLGIYTFEQISSFSQGELQWVDENLTSFKGRAFRDDWIAQAKALLA